ncbi:MAG: winged helix-turn-helix domain-containing protein [Candidatus Hodarchaeota archaeon]
MAIPDYQSIMLPLLIFAGDSREHSFREAIEFLAEEFNLSAEDRRERKEEGSALENGQMIFLLPLKEQGEGLNLIKIQASFPGNWAQA